MDEKDKPGLDASYGSGSAEENRRVYRDWAATYDPAPVTRTASGYAAGSYIASNDPVRPVASNGDSGAEAVPVAVTSSGERRLYMKADWFAARATLPPLYHDLLGIPLDVRKLEKRLGVDVRRNIERHRVARAGVQVSGVSQYNRLIERRYAQVFG